MKGCAKLNQADQTDSGAVEAAIRELFGSARKDPSILPGFACDNGKNIHVGEEFLVNYNVTILDIAPVSIGDYVMIGPNTLITTVNYPISPKKRRRHLGQAKPVVIGNDVWIGFEAVILAGVTIGDGAIIGARAVVTKDVPPYTIVGGVPARPIRKRFSDEDIAALLALKWWDLPPAQLLERIKYIQSGNLAALKEMR